MYLKQSGNCNIYYYLNIFDSKNFRQFFCSLLIKCYIIFLVILEVGDFKSVFLHINVDLNTIALTCFVIYFFSKAFVFDDSVMIHIAFILVIYFLNSSN